MFVDKPHESDPMSDDQEPKLTPKDGVDAVMNLIPGLMDATAGNDLKGIDGIMDQLGHIAGAAGLDMTDIGRQLNDLKGESAKAQQHFENSDAALWAGDTARWKALNEKGPQLDYAKLGSFHEDYAPDADALDSAPATEEELAALYAEAGLDPALLHQEILPDRYADIAEGTPGAVAAFIATQQDPNVFTGDSQHNALLAALDAPARNAVDLQALIAAGANPCVIHPTGDTALSWAMGYRHLDTVTAESEMQLVALLVSAGVDVNHQLPDFGSPFRRALIEGEANQVAAMLAAGADPHANLPMDFPVAVLAGVTPLVAAAPKPAVIALLLAHGVDPKALCADGQTSAAFISQHADAADARADPNDPWTISHAQALRKSLDLLPDGPLSDA